MGFNCSSSAAACDSFRVKQSFTRRLCAFLPCFDGRCPTVEADTHPYTWNGDLSRSLVSERVRYLRSSQHKTSCSPAAHTDVPESGLQSADKSALAIAAPAADKDQQVLIRAVTATAVPGSPPELQVQDLQQEQQSISSYGQRLSSQTKDQVEMQDLQQQQQQAISSCGPGLLSQKKGLVEKEELLTDHEAAADMRRHSSCEEQVQQPAEGQSAESIR